MGANAVERSAIAQYVEEGARRNQAGRAWLEAGITRKGSEPGRAPSEARQARYRIAHGGRIAPFQAIGKNNEGRAAC